MTMTKREKAEVDAERLRLQGEIDGLKMRIALRLTEADGPDIPIPKGHWKTRGWLANASAPWVEEYESSENSHGTPGYRERRTGTQGGVALFSNRELAWRWVRAQKELEFARALQKIDREIERVSRG